MHSTRLPLSDHTIDTLERATLDAVAPPVVEEIEGWLLPFDHSTIGRAKSAVPLRHHTLDDAQIRMIEERYAQHQMPPAFRVADVPGLVNVHHELARLGYLAMQPTLVQVGTVRTMRQVCQDAPAQVSTTPTEAWSRVYLAQGFDPVDGAHRVQALSRSPQVVYASVVEAGQSLSAGTASFGHGWAGIHGMRTVPGSRGRGLAGRVLAGLADAVLARSFNAVFLQVEESSTAALALYRRAGFATAWRYHYWRKPNPTR
jgi:ribosomal protein S18 acetylase RimI-like enzyme